MDFTFYTLGDIEIFRAALTAVAMVFSADGSFVGEGGLGIGQLSVFALLVALTTILIQGVLKHKLDLTEFIVMIAVFVALFVPKFRVQIEDYYESGRIAAVDGVPLGIAFPASMMSQIVRAMNERISTVYSTVEGGYYTNVTAPLKVLNGFQKAATTVDPVDTVFGQNLRSYTTFCLAQREGFDMAKWKSLAVKDDFVASITEIETTGFSVAYTSGDNVGVAITCSDFKSKISKDANDFYANSFDKVINRTMLAATRTVRQGAITKGQPLSVADYQQAFQNLLGGNAEQAKNYALMMLFTPHVNGAMQCAPDATNFRDLSSCMSYASVLPQAAQNSAAAGSFFQRIMIYGMNALLFLWICLAPVVAVVMLISATKGLKIAGSYLLFGAWSQSWFIGAAIINFFIQKQIQYELDLLGGVGNLSYDQFGQFSESLSIKMMLAGDMLASVPLLMMSVMSGSAYAMTQMAQRFATGAKYDATVNAPSLTQGTPLASPTTMGEYERTTGIFKRTGLADPTYSISGSYENVTQSLNSARNQAAYEVSDTASRLIQNVSSHAHEVGSGTSMLASMRQSNSSVDRAAATAVSGILKQSGVNESTSVGLTNEVAGVVTATVASPSVPFLPKVSAELAAKVGADKRWSQQRIDQEATKIEQTLLNARENITASERSTAFDTANTNRSVWATSESETLSQQQAQALKRSQSVEQAYQVAAAMKDGGGLNMNFTPANFAHTANLRSINADKYERALIDEVGSERFEKIYSFAEKAVASDARGSALNQDPQMMRYAALYEAASSLSPKQALLMTAEAAGRSIDIDTLASPGSYQGLNQNPETAFRGGMNGTSTLRSPSRITEQKADKPLPSIGTATDLAMPATPRSPDAETQQRIYGTHPTLSPKDVILGKSEKSPTRGSK